MISLLSQFEVGAEECSSWERAFSSFLNSEIACLIWEKPPNELIHSDFLSPRADWVSCERLSVLSEVVYVFLSNCWQSLSCIVQGIIKLTLSIPKILKKDEKIRLFFFFFCCYFIKMWYEICKVSCKAFSWFPIAD